ncbi:hypothetical protein GGF42_002065, partial [Coemansia sp. RSA 2424]
MAVFERAVAAMQAEWRRFELERAEWDVERIRLKAKLSAADKRIEHLGSLYRVSQKHITVLEQLLSEARGGGAGGGGEGGEAGGKVAPESSNTGSSSLSTGPSDDGDASIAIKEMVAVTQSTRQRSRELLGRCLGEIEILLGSTGPAPRTSPSPMPSPSIAENLRLSASCNASNVSALGPGVTLLKRATQPAIPNGVIESEVIDT